MCVVHSKNHIKFVFLFLILMLSFNNRVHCEDKLPIRIDGGSWESPAGHLQGIACDDKHEYMYMSFTDRLIKIDMRTNTIVASVTGLHEGGIYEGAHLGCLAFYNNKIYASLEYKSMEKFYVAIFDCDSITHMNMDYKEVMRSIYIEEAVKDYCDNLDAGEHDNRADSGGHRYGCSGIDGITFGRMPGKTDGKIYMFVAYGIYGNPERSDNDYQVILVYDPDLFSPSFFDQENPHTNGPDLARKLFVYTGNTTYGIQNMEYDKDSGDLWLIVNKGAKKGFPNYSVFLVDGSKEPTKRLLNIQDINYDPYLMGEVLTLKKGFGQTHETGITGIANKVLSESNGFISLGQDYFYIADSGKTDNKQFGIAVLMKLNRDEWVFIPVD